MLPRAEGDDGSEDDLDPGEPGNQPLSNWPAPRNPDFPRGRNGQPDWCAALRQLDGGNATAFASIFPDLPGPLDSHDLARPYFKRRQSGALREEGIRLLVGHYSSARSYGDHPLRDWRVKTPGELLYPKTLRLALEVTRESVREEIQVLNEQMELLNYDVTVPQQLYWARRWMAEANVATAEELLRYVRYRDDVVASLVVAKHERGLCTIKAAVTCREKILDELAASHRWREFYREARIDPLATLAIPDEEIAALQHGIMQPLVDRKATLQALLQ